MEKQGQSQGLTRRGALVLAGVLAAAAITGGAAVTGLTRHVSAAPAPAPATHVVQVAAPPAYVDEEGGD